MTGHEQNLMGRDYPKSNFDSKTKNTILHVSTLLFAKHGYSTVSMKEIAAEVGIKASSLYNHFASKEDLWNTILDFIESTYMVYFERLGETLRTAGSFREVLDVMTVELKEIIEIFNYYGFSLVMNEQLRDEKAADIFLKSFLDESICYITDQFDICVEKGMVKPFDTRLIATLMMHSVLVNNHLRIHEDLNHPVPYDISGMWCSFEAFLLERLQ